MGKVRKYQVIENIGDKTPTKSMFKLIAEPRPQLQKDQFLVQAEYISVDPYMWSFARTQQVPYVQYGFQVGKVIKSNNKDFPVDRYVVSHAGWCDYAVLDNLQDEIFGISPYQPDIGSLPLSLAVGALGMPGLAAYLGFLEVCKPEQGDVVCVTGAAGAVGHLVGQIAIIKKCTVIGLTGTDEKVKILKDELHFNHAFNYKTEKDIRETLKGIAPNGINCFFDNVGGKLSNEIMGCVSKRARVANCGAISTYGSAKAPTQERSSSAVSTHIEAFSFTQWETSIQNDALKQMRKWIEEKAIVPKETVTRGFEHLPDAFIGMLNGANVGKAVVKI